MTGSRIFALSALVAFMAFFAVIVVFVPHVDLGIAIAIGLVLAGYDLWTQLGPRSR